MDLFMNASRRLIPTLAAVPLLLSTLMSPARAQDAADVEQLRATTMAILQALVENGLLARDKAEAIVKQAQQAARAKAETATAQPRAADAPAATGAATAPTRAVIRVPYVSESTKNELREQVRQEVLAQAKEERWGHPGALPDWLSRLTLEGDVRVRDQLEVFDPDNQSADAPNAVFLAQNRTAGPSLAWAPDLTNTTHNRNRLTLRARLGVTAQLGDGVQAGIRLASGSNASPVSTSQTLGANGSSNGSNLGKYSIWLDRAYVQWQPRADVALHAGRFANPFYGTDLTWPDDLNFDGLAASYKNALGPRDQWFATAGAFALQEFEQTSADKWLYGAQVGLKHSVDYDTSVDVGLAYYNFNNVEGVFDPNDPPADLVKAASNYLSSEYPKSVRQKGNTLIRLNPTYDSSSVALAPVWGLASKFRPLDLSVGVSLNQFKAMPVRATVDYVKNIGFSMADIRRRSGMSDLDLPRKNTAVQMRVDLGARKIDKAGDWQAFAAWRRLERDAWIDAFTDTTWHLGGTNYQGWSLGGHYGVAPRTSVGARITSTQNLTDGASVLTGSGSSGVTISSAPIKIDVFQLELNSRF